MMLDFLGQAPGAEAARYQDAHDAILRAIEQICEQGPRTRDMGGTAFDRGGRPGDRGGDLSGNRLG